MPALSEISRSLKKYGHGETELVFTDNVRADKAELERVFPSLLKDVTPIPASTKQLEIPENWQERIHILSTTFQVTNFFNTITEDLTLLPSDGLITIPFDMEWSVDRMTGIQGRVALIQVIYNHGIYLIPLRSYLDHDGYLRKLPRALLAFLRSPRLLKVGVNVQADLTRLFKDCGLPDMSQPFVGALELGKMAKERNLVDRANVSLADLTAKVLHCSLSKDEHIRVSTAWDTLPLTPEQERYAALDVFAVFGIYDAFTELPVGGPVTSATVGGTVVKLLSRDRHTTVAYGVVAPDRPKKFGDVNVTKTRALVNVTRILASGYLTRAEVSPARQEVPLSSLATTLPFQLLCCTRDLRICVGSDLNEARLLESGSSPSNTPAIEPPAPEVYTPDGNPISPSHTSDSAPSFTDVDNGIDFDPDIEQSVEEAVHHSEDHSALLEEVLLFIAGDPVVRSRVLGDIWHLMDMFDISVHHGLRRAFARALRDALYIHNLDDKLEVTSQLAKDGITYEQKILWSSDWVWRRVRRYVPPPEILLPRVREVFQKFGPLLDATTGQPLFNNAAWDKAKNILENIRLGYYSDPPGVTLYRSDGYDSNGLQLYQCLRGTNNVEGGVHQNIAKRFGSYNASPRFAVNLIRDYCFTHNTSVGAKNRLQHTVFGSYDIWTRNRLVALIDHTEAVFTNPAKVRQCVTGWVNGGDYEPSAESFGILPLSTPVQEKLGMLPYHYNFAVDTKMRHHQLAWHQGTRIAILPIHTPEERAVFRALVKQPNGEFSKPTKPNWITVARKWMSYCDGVKVFYKLPEHLKNYFKTWSEYRNQDNSVELNKIALTHLQSLLDVPPTTSKSLPTITVEAKLPLDKQVDSNRRIHAPDPEFDLTDPDGARWRFHYLLSGQGCLQSAIQFQYGDRALPGPSMPVVSNPHIAPSAANISGNKKRRMDKESSEVDHPAKKRRTRSCTQCKRSDCQGAFMSRGCQFVAISSGSGGAGPSLNLGSRQGTIDGIFAAQAASGSSSGIGNRHYR
ncbi:uncharacterized protein ARMOST_17245 [Armillaria ostoyae]|uniref:3'-5' exonuclease n=1 Tax=Armillaria ostoyae TaxID=47428 RepID=A0A284RYK3_ARMOS|nr:uncharacterized protein ARMOST_17245 [Armillaria ostoyae]